jgi:UDP-N-acetylglucosamine--N-acetylmuramyl-(pentapeptide) pyrophosphoryl-undecaprenol N-acetylglucosamine transferase
VFRVSPTVQTFGSEIETANSAAVDLVSTSSTALCLALAGGGTGGHVVPGMHLLRSLEGNGDLASLLWFGAGRMAEQRALAGIEEQLGEGVRFTKVDLPLEPASGGAPSLRDLAKKVLPATLAARKALKTEGCDVVCGLGGFTSLPVVLAARSLGLPVALLEINAVEGRATRWLSPLVQRVFHAWPSTMPRRQPEPARTANQSSLRHGKHRLIGPPLSPEYLAPPLQDFARKAAVETLGFSSDRPLVLVLGGSQGAHSLNLFIKERLHELIANGLSVLHQVGPGRMDEAASDCDHYRAVEYIDDVGLGLRTSRLVLCRGGASTLAEIAAAGTPAVVVPYPHHKDQHQRANAEALAEGVVIVEESSGQDELFTRVLDLARNDLELEQRAKLLLDSIPRDGARQLFEELTLLSASRVSHD